MTPNRSGRHVDPRHRQDHGERRQDNDQRGNREFQAGWKILRLARYALGGNQSILQYLGQPDQSGRLGATQDPVNDREGIGQCKGDQSEDQLATAFGEATDVVAAAGFTNTVLLLDEQAVPSLAVSVVKGDLMPTLLRGETPAYQAAEDERRASKDFSETL